MEKIEIKGELFLIEKCGDHKCKLLEYENKDISMIIDFKVGYCTSNGKAKSDSFERMDYILDNKEYVYNMILDKLNGNKQLSLF